MGGIARILNAYGVELSKAARQKQVLAGPALVLLAVLVGAAVQPIRRDGVSDYGFVAFIVPVALNNLGFALTLVFSAGLIAGELATGSIRQILVRPIRRREYVLAKLLTALTYNMLLMLAAVVPAWALVYLLGEAHGITVGGELIYTGQEALEAFAGGLLLSLPPQWAGAALALALSAATRSPVLAVSVSVGGWLIGDLLKYAAGIERYLFTSYLESAWDVFAQRCLGLDAAWTPGAWFVAGTAAPVIVAGAAAAIALMERRNLAG